MDSNLKDHYKRTGLRSQRKDHSLKSFLQIDVDGKISAPVGIDIDKETRETSEILTALVCES